MYRLMKSKIHDRIEQQNIPSIIEDVTKEQAKEIVAGMLGRMAIKGENDQTSQKTIEQTSRLTEHQREILKSTFKQMGHDSVKIGLTILVKLFAEYPRYKLIWPQFRAIPDSSLMHAIELRRHASVYMCGLGSIIQSMRNEEELAAQLNRIARAHINVFATNLNYISVTNTLKKSSSKSTHMLDPVLDVVKECNGYQMDNETKEAWTTLYDVIANLIDIYRNKPH
uniref:GLOBIN domain-containing protein n=1 Tax=Heterorhabditis bacteriophora TaxID=37862 RepID=A0A1I7WMA7_HETBA